MTLLLMEINQQNIYKICVFEKTCFWDYKCSTIFTPGPPNEPAFVLFKIFQPSDLYLSI